MRCTQSLNEFWDSFETLLAEHRASVRTMEIRTPLNDLYAISCSLVEDEENTTTDRRRLRSVTYRLQPPMLLRRRAIVPKRSATTAVSSMCRDISGLFLLFGIEEEWTSFLASEGISLTANLQGDDDDDIFEHIGVSSSSAKSSLQSEIEKKLQDRIANIYVNRAQTSFFAGNKRVDSISDEIDAYIRRGNVLFKGLTVVDEIAAVKKLRDVLLNYGHTINFRLSTWWRVVIILAPSQKYSTESASDRYLVKAPSDFKVKPLLKHMRAQLPMADLTYNASLIIK